MTESAMMVVIVGFMIAVIFVAAKKSKARTQAQVNEANQNGSQEHNFCKRLNSMRERVIADVFKGESACECDGSKNYFVVDFETTDLTRRWGSVASVAIGLVIDGELVDSAYTVVRPTRRMSEAARAVNGLSDAVLQRAPDSLPILKSLATVLTLLPMVSYNTFDLEILKDLAESENVDLSSMKLHIDAMRLATNVLNRNGKWLKLTEACQDLGIDYANAHNAQADVRATAKVVRKLFDMIRESDGNLGDGETWFSSEPFSAQ